MRRNKFGWNYPPGAANDPNAPYNQPDHSHEHRWQSVKPDYPIFEDCAAIFHEACEYAEGRWGEGWQCEETRWLRCEAVRIIKLRDGEPDVTYLVDEIEWEDGFSPVERLFERTVVRIETTGPDPDEGIGVLDVDPPTDLGDGFVRVRVGSYIVEYEQ